jgi:isopenicillin-N N-acyltransferase-like protein
VNRIFPKIVSEGDPYTRGHHLGVQARGLIARNLQIYFEHFKYHANLDADEVKCISRKYISVINDRNPSIMDEIRGIASGAELTVEEIVALNIRYELLHPSFKECTSFAVMPHATSEKHMLMGQNWDWIPAVRDSCLLWEIRQNKHPAILCLTEAGIVGGKMGFNSAGIGLCINALYSNLDRREIGVPFHITCREILNAKILSEAISAVTLAKRSCSCNFLIACGNEEVIDLEATPNDVGFGFPSEGITTHANHFITRVNVGDQGKLQFPNTLLRDMRMRRFLLSRKKEIDIGFLQQVLTDHFNYPDSICCHPNIEVHPMEQFQTNATVIIDLDEFKMIFAKGPPCQNSYESTCLEKS